MRRLAPVSLECIFQGRLYPACCTGFPSVLARAQTPLRPSPAHIERFLLSARCPQKPVYMHMGQAAQDLFFGIPQFASARTWAVTPFL
jgi:hypothetical protein